MNEHSYAASLLSSSEAEDILASALSTIPAKLESWHLDALHTRPGAETSAGYDVTASGRSMYVVASTAELSEEQRTKSESVRLESDAGVIYVWCHPRDPHLPGLFFVCTTDSLAERFEKMGWGHVDVVGLTMLVLRPLRRAVLRAEIVRDGENETVFVKVLRPDRAALVLQRHALAEIAPRAFDAGEGIVVIEAAEGVPLTEFFYRQSSRRDISPVALVEALDTLHPDAVTLPRRPSPTELIGTYAASAIAAGWDREMIQGVVEAVAGLSLESQGAIVATHGDFHAANVFVGGSEATRVKSLIDIDTLGPGLRVDDLACMLAHLYTLPTFDTNSYPDVPAFTDAVLAEFSTHVPVRQLRVRTAAVLVSLLTGCDDRERGGEWLQRAQRLVSDHASFA